MLWYNHSFEQMCLLIGTGFLGEQCGPCTNWPSTNLKRISRKLYMKLKSSTFLLQECSIKIYPKIKDISNAELYILCFEEWFHMIWKLKWAVLIICFMMSIGGHALLFTCGGEGSMTLCLQGQTNDSLVIAVTGFNR